MIFRAMKTGALHEGVTNGLIRLIPKEGDTKDLNYWTSITLLTISYKVSATNSVNLGCNQFCEM